MIQIGIIGTGRLGICQALCLDSVGYDVYCYDINKELMHNIKNKTLQTNEPFVAEMLRNSKLKVAESEEFILKTCSVILVFIQTPSDTSGEYDHSYIDMFVSKCASMKQDIKKVIAICSTVMPEYTDSIVDKLKDYDVCYNPTFIAQGSIIDNLINPNLILIGGHSVEAMNIIESMHKKVVRNDASIHKMTPLEAEVCKISINCFITTKISFANMIGDLLISKGYEPSSVLKAIGSDSRIGSKCLQYGYGFGGPCFPRDNRALNYYGKKEGMDLSLCTTTDKLNRDHLLNQYKIMKETQDSITFTLVSYKDNSDILEESQKLKLAIMLADSGINVVIKERAHIIKKLKEEYADKFIYEEI